MPGRDGWRARPSWPASPVVILWPCGIAGSLRTPRAASHSRTRRPLRLRAILRPCGQHLLHRHRPGTLRSRVAAACLKRGRGLSERTGARSANIGERQGRPQPVFPVAARQTASAQGARCRRRTLAGRPGRVRRVSLRAFSAITLPFDTTASRSGRRRSASTGSPASRITRDATHPFRKP